jgi:hypothetical protein
MNNLELIKVTDDGQVNARDLHEFLEVKLTTTIGSCVCVNMVLQKG